MAYAFGRLNAALGQPEQSDIFGGGQPQDMDQQQSGGGMQRSASTGGAAVGQGGGSSPAPDTAGPASSPAPSTNVFQQISERNKPQALGAIGNISSGIASSVQKAQTEADKYVSGQKVKAPKAGSVDKAANSGNFDGIVNFLNGAPATAADFQTTAELPTSDLEKLGSRTGVGELITKQAGKSYDPRLSGFDASLTMAGQGFQKSKTALDKEAAAAERSLGKIDKTAEQSAQKSLAAQEKAARDAIMKEVKQLRDAETAKAQGAMEAERQRRLGLNTSMENPAQKAARLAAGNQGMTAAQQELLAADPSLAAYMDRARFDLGAGDQYLSANTNVGDLSAYYGDQGRSRFKNLNDLFAVGGGTRAAEIAEGAKTGEYNFNKDAYAQALRAAVERIKSGNKPAQTSSGGGKKPTGKGAGAGIVSELNPAGAVESVGKKIKSNPLKSMGRG